MTQDEWSQLVNLMRHIPGRTAQIAGEVARLRDEMIQLTEDVLTLQTLAQGVEALVPIIRGEVEVEAEGEPMHDPLPPDDPALGI